ncbi:hypothetical protein EMIT0P12_10992 [Pseudomonas sp. IT-P12]
MSAGDRASDGMVLPVICDSRYQAWASALYRRRRWMRKGGSIICGAGSGISIGREMMSLPSKIQSQILMHEFIKSKRRLSLG